MELYPLDVKDIEAIGRSRANRSIPKKVRNIMYGGIFIFAIGIIYWILQGGWMSFGIMVVGAAVVWYSSMQSDKWRRVVIKECKRLWRETKEKVGSQE